MASALDRHSVKEKILENVAKAVKSIQGKYVTADPENPVFLGNYDDSCQKLCENLDRVFLHGLKHIQHGYWKVVSEFTDKQTRKDIKHLQHVTTDLGRGRAWLFMALNDCLLESYVRCYEENIKIVRKHYVKEALLLNQQNVNVLLTLTAGLEFVVFQLDYDIPYLDLGVSPRPRSVSQLSVDEDRVSLCSMDSIASIRPSSAYSSIESDTSDTRSISSIDPNLNSLKSEGCVDNKAQRLDSVVAGELENAEEEPSIEVIRHKGHSKHGHGKKRKSKKKSASPVLIEPLDEYEEDFVENVEKKLVEDPQPEVKLVEKEKEPGYVSKFREEEKLEDILSSIGESHTIHRNDSSENNLNSQIDREMDNSQEHIKEMNGISSNVSENENKSPEVDVYKSQEVRDYDFSEVDEDSEKLNHFHTENISVNQKVPTPTLSDETDVCLSRSGNVQYGISNSHDNISCDIEENYGQSEKVDSKQTDSKSQTCDERDSGPGWQNSEVLKSSSDDLSIYSSSFSTGDKTSSASQMQDMVDHIISQSDASLQPHMFEEEPEELMLNEEKEVNQLHPGEVRLENNTRLELMLNIFENSEEQFVRMYVSRLGHTDGDDHPVFILLTDHGIYLLNQNQSNFKFIKDCSIPYSSIDYISLTISDQIIHIVCKKRRNQYWLTTGSQQVTRCIIDCIQEQMKHLQDKQISVLSDAKTQMIALRKHIAKESNCEMSEVEIACYSLVHWGSDLESKKHKMDTAYREGHLLYRVVDSSGGLLGLSSQILNTVQDPKSLLYGQSWKSGYVILRDGMLCVYPEKNGKPIMFVHMGDDCTGCRRSSKSDRDHCIEVIKQDGSSWQFALANEEEANDWLQRLCQAVAEGLQKKELAKPSCLPCCAILTSNKLFLFHEDLQISFFRTLGSANIADIVCLLVDPALNTYCILEFESYDGGHSQDKWVIYFNDEAEKERFCQVLSDMWIKFFQIEEMPVFEIEDFSLQRTCRMTATQLENSLKVREQKH
ncbi:pleckstrin homology domain-containing family M member 2-like [Saccostrea echinata]|uniref:pleckstrin homology domain-containing family M member 2-like n=1 Tax=Saccostrea echinata TaxID=191078 RepID=UPI002A7F3665|nr:pleckstrin homology domain-containing family M member 2-like [Saccostrea echinata]